MAGESGEEARRARGEPDAGGAAPMPRSPDAGGAAPMPRSPDAGGEAAGAGTRADTGAGAREAGPAERVKAMRPSAPGIRRAVTSDTEGGIFEDSSVRKSAGPPSQSSPAGLGSRPRNASAASSASSSRGTGREVGVGSAPGVAGADGCAVDVETDMRIADKSSVACVCSEGVAGAGSASAGASPLKESSIEARSLHCGGGRNIEVDKLSQLHIIKSELIGAIPRKRQTQRGSNHSLVKPPQLVGFFFSHAG